MIIDTELQAVREIRELVNFGKSRNWKTIRLHLPQVDNLLTVLDDAKAENKRLKEKNFEWSERFNRHWDATLRGVELWRNGHPDRELILPDCAKHTEWLIRQTADVAEHAQLRADLAEWKEKHTIIAGSLNVCSDENEKLEERRAAAERTIKRRNAELDVVYQRARVLRDALKPMVRELNKCRRRYNEHELNFDEIRENGQFGVHFTKAELDAAKEAHDD